MHQKQLPVRCVDPHQDNTLEQWLQDQRKVFHAINTALVWSSTYLRAFHNPLSDTAYVIVTFENLSFRIKLVSFKTLKVKVHKKRKHVLVLPDLNSDGILTLRQHYYFLE